MSISRSLPLGTARTCRHTFRMLTPLVAQVRMTAATALGKCGHGLADPTRDQ